MSIVGTSIVMTNLTLPAGDGSRAVRRASGDLVQRHLTPVAVVHADDQHAEVQKVGDDRK